MLVREIVGECIAIIFCNKSCGGAQQHVLVVFGCDEDLSMMHEMEGYIKRGRRGVGQRCKF